MAYVRVRNRFRELIEPAADQAEALARWESQVVEPTLLRNRRPAPVGPSLAHVRSEEGDPGTAELKRELFAEAAKVVKAAALAGDLRNYSTSTMRTELLGQPRFRERELGRDERWAIEFLHDSFGLTQCFNQVPS